MRLTWKDLAATAAVAAGGGLYAWHLAAPDAVLVESVRGVTVALFVLGVVACATGGSYGTTGGYTRTMSLGALGALALLLTGLVTGSAAVLAALAALIGLMWLVTTVRHALGIYPPPARAPAPKRSHEEIAQQPVDVS